MNYIFSLLKEINANPGINQRALASITRISLGKVNSAIEELEYNKYISKDVKGKEHKYYITENGLELLEQELRSS